MSQLRDRSKSRLIRVSVPALLLIALSLGLTAVAVHWESRHDDTLTVFLLGSIGALNVALAIYHIGRSREFVGQSENLERSLARERELGELKSRFVSMVSHEIRTPLTTIHAATDILKHYGAQMTEAERRVEIDAIQSEIGAITGLVDDVLTIDGSAERQPRLNVRPLELDVVAHDIWTRCRTNLQVGHELDLEISGDLGPALLDVTRFRQILDNLLTNAMKYSPGAPAVRLGLRREGGWLTVTVTDRGVGIPEADLARVFEAFHRGGNVEAISGSGLGLTVVQRAAQQHGGSVAVSSTVGQGTTVTVRLREGEAGKAG